VVLAPRHALQPKLINNVQEVRARGARTIVFATDGDDSLAPYADSLILLPNTKSLLTPLLTLVPMQVLSAEIARPAGWTSTSRATSPSRSRSSDRRLRWHTAPMRSRLLVTGLLLLGVSLLITLLTVRSGTAGDVRAAAVLGWFAQASLFVGAGLTVAGAVLQELRRTDPEHADPVDSYGG
jgi:hypothetical protein